MPSRSPFLTPDGTVDIPTVLSESIPIARLVGLFAGLSLIPFAAGFAAVGADSVAGAAFVAIGQLVLAVGAGVVLLHVLVRARYLSGE